MKSTLLACALLIACSHDPGASGDDTNGSIDAAGSADGDGGVTAVDPVWPENVALPAEFDFPPYLNLLEPTTVVVSWRTVAASTGKVHFGTSAALGMELASATSANLHHVSLSGLLPATAYYYEVSIDNTSAVRKGVFVTPGATKWRFLHSGEFHAPSEATGAAKFAAAIREFRPHVLVESGDMVDDGTLLSDWRSYLRVSAPWISNVLLMPAHSNHVNGTGGNANLVDLFVLPGNERWYMTRYGQVEFLTLDSTYDANSDVLSTEVPWIGTEAAAAHDGTDDPTFLIAAWHYPACSSQYYSRASQRTWMQTNFVGTFKAHGGLDLILAAHDKYYERSTITGGIVHLITNIGNISPEIPGGNHADCTAVKTIRDTRSTAYFTVDGSTLTAVMRDEAAVEIDTFMIAK